MEPLNNLYSHSDKEILKQIGEKIKTARLNENITQSELQRITGVHAKTIGEAEAGKNVTLETLVAILRGLRMLDLLNELLREESVSPVMMAKYRGKAPQRASGKV
ncbi:MAG: helix-turn-helix domain-containing protein [Methanomassiliicoccaceae archaeon]|nr:helix-turn-helix domain-containing protein [Methanomassiliicoccaceae archaeon]